MSAETLGRARDVIERELRERFKDVTFESVEVSPDYDEDNFEYILVNAVFDATKARPDIETRIRFKGHLIPKLLELGTDAFPVMFYISK